MDQITLVHCLHNVLGVFNPSFSRQLLQTTGAYVGKYRKIICNYGHIYVKLRLKNTFLVFMYLFSLNVL